MSKVTGTCSLCEASCAAVMDVEEGRIVRVRPDPEDALSAGFICAKGAAIPEIEANPARLDGPLLRRNGVLEPATWEEAFRFISDRLQAVHEQHGRDSVAVYAGNGLSHNLGMQTYIGDLIRGLGTKNLFTAGTLDQIPRQAVSALLYGSASSVTIPDLDRNQLLWIIGANPAESNGSLITAPGFLRRLQAIQERGGRVVVIDPRRTMTAKRASEHIAIRPSADAAFLAAVAHELLRLGPVPSRALSLCGDLSDLSAMLAPFAPEAAAGHCGIDADTIRRLAKELRDTPSASLYGRMGTTTQVFASLVCWLMDIVNILAGNMDAIGGAMFCTPLFAQDNTIGTPGRGKGMTFGRWRSRVRQAPEVLGELPTACLVEEIETPGEGQVKALFVAAGNPIISNPNAADVSRALRSLDLLVCLDIHVNQTGSLADVVLPSPPRLAKSNYDVMFYQFAVRLYGRYTPAYRPLEPDERSDREILLRLAAIARHEDPANFEDHEREGLLKQVEREVNRVGSRIEGRDPLEIVAMLERLSPQERKLDFAFRIGPHGDAFGARAGITFETVRHAEHGLDLGPLQPRLPEVLRTRSGTIEWRQPFVADELARLDDWLKAEQPRFIMVGRRQLRSNNSWMQHIPSLQHKTRKCRLQMNDGDALELGLADGDLASVSTGSGQIEVEVAVTEDIASGVVSMPHGWGPGPNGTITNPAVQGANINTLTDAQATDPLTGTACLNGYAVQITPILALHDPQVGPMTA
ncbi:molybdopterin-dependent oxidoreductase [Novosphingobium sp. 9U]|uniref:molybdopterin-dependent oxidoreductase n=1 Tax=Novosphingobium sp. 9U TaxID=2653158 RepID=UPI0012F3138A|nr:molybdopterin-dependent oxidoreductase [Novosphingobium sp. 9U]VWX50605.1 Formate dehydrogenase-O, major subunit [Novosphingobium sp. 9U]